MGRCEITGDRTFFLSPASIAIAHYGASGGRSQNGGGNYAYFGFALRLEFEWGPDSGAMWGASDDLTDERGRGRHP